jgi:hypothetical protein
MIEFTRRTSSHDDSRKALLGGASPSSNFLLCLLRRRRLETLESAPQCIDQGLASRREEVSNFDGRLVGGFGLRESSQKAGRFIFVFIQRRID